jgi:hypothetical protein
LRLLGSLRPTAAPNDDTVLLSSNPSPQPLNSTLGDYPPLNPVFGRPRRRNGLRRPFLVLALIFAAGFVVAELITSISRSDNPVPSGYNTPSGESAHATAPPVSSYGDASSIERSRLAQLRASLDNHGFAQVKFRVDGDTLILYGSVPTDFDRATVQLICMTTTGITSLSDNLTITSDDADD